MGGSSNFYEYEMDVLMILRLSLLLRGKETGFVQNGKAEQEHKISLRTG